MKKTLKSASFILCLFISLSILSVFVVNPRTQKDHFSKELVYDIYGYYIYLPLTFIYDDIGLKNKTDYDTIFNKYKPSPTFYQVYRIDNGNFTMNYTCGFALLQAPFFFIAHAWAKNSSVYPPDGHSFPYHICIALGIILFYVIPGCFILRKVLLYFFDEKITFLSLLFIVFGTNYFHEASNGYMGPHAIIFTGYALLLWLSIKWHDSPNRKTAAFIGFVVGIIILARPSEILCVFIPLLWNIWDKPSWKVKWELIKNNLSHLLILIFCAFIIFIPQFIYWKYVTDSWIFFSYQNTEGFDLLQPHIYKVLFSFKKSWFIYTPIIIFPIIGVFLLVKNNKKIFWPILLYFLTNFYLLSCWAAWWNGGSFGMRYFVESYAVMAIPFGYVIQGILRLKFLLRVLLFLIMTLFTFLNLFQTWQYLKGIIPVDRMTFGYYKAIFLNTKITADDIKLMEVERSYSEDERPFNPENYTKRTLAYYNYETINSTYVSPTNIDSTHFLSPPYSCRLDANFNYSPGIHIPYENLTKEDHVWIRMTLHYFPIYDMKENPVSLVINLQHKKYLNKYHASDLEKFPCKLNEWNTYTFDYMTPFPHNESDILNVYVWLRGNQPIYIDDFHIECFDKK